jgi:hypothetical protein
VAPDCSAFLNVPNVSSKSFFNPSFCTFSSKNISIYPSYHY